MWPFKHNWSASYRVTFSFKTDILVSESGLEQRIAQRYEPRRTIETNILADGPTARSFDRFLWSTQAEAFTHVDPVTEVASTVRLGDTQGVEHPTDGVAVANLSLAVEPGTDTYTDYTIDYSNVYQGRLVFPFTVNWIDGTPDSLSIPRRLIDYGRGRIAVDRPIAFASRTSTFALQQVTLAETATVVDFFRITRGRQGDFWFPSVLDDLKVVETVSTTVEVDGADAYTMYLADPVNVGLRFETYGGAVYFRRIVEAELADTVTVLTLDLDVPDTVFRKVSWLRVGRFASDDLTIEWITNRVAQTQVQLVTLPYAVPEGDYALSEGAAWLIDYYGSAFAQRVILDSLDRVLNIKEPQFAQV